MRVFRPPRHYAFASRVRASGHTEGTSPERQRGTAPNSAHDLHASIRTQRATCGHLPRRLIGIRPLTRRPQHPSLKELSPGQFFPLTSYLTIFLFVVTLNPGRTARDCQVVSIVAPGDPTCNRVRWAAVRNCHTMMPVPVGPRRAPTHPVPPAPPAPAIVPAEIWYLLNFVHGKWKPQFPTSIVASVVSYNLRQDFSQKTLPLFLCGLPGSLFWAQKSSKSSGEDRI